MGASVRPPHALVTLDAPRQVRVINRFERLAIGRGAPQNRVAIAAQVRQRMVL